MKKRKPKRPRTQRDNFSTPEQPSYLIQFLYRVSSNPNDAAIATPDLSSDATLQLETKTRVVPAFSMQSVRQPRSPWWHDVRPNRFSTIPFQLGFPGHLPKIPQIIRLDEKEKSLSRISHNPYFLSITVQSNRAIT